MKKNVLMMVAVVAMGVVGAEYREIKITDAPFEMPVLREWIPPKASVSVADFKGDFNRAIAAIAAKGGGRVVVPAGKWVSAGPIRLKSNVELHLEQGAVVEHTDNPDDYKPVVLTTWEAVECYNLSPLVHAHGCTNIAITGSGAFSPRMDTWRKWFARPPDHMAFTAELYRWCSEQVPLAERDCTKLKNANARPPLIEFNRCANIVLDGFTVRNSPMWLVHLFHCENAIVRNLDLKANGHNNDGVDVDMTKNVLIENCIFDQGDDTVVIKSLRNHDGWRLNRLSENVVIRNCDMREGHALMAVGSDLSGGIRNVYMHNCRAKSVYRVFFLKTHHRRGGFAENIWMKDCSIDNVRQDAFEFDSNVLFQFAKFPDYEKRITRLRNFNFENVKVGSAGLHGISMKCDPSVPADGVTFRNVTVGKAKIGENIYHNVSNLVVNGQSIPFKSVGLRESVVTRALHGRVLPMAKARSSRAFAEAGEGGTCASASRHEISRHVEEGITIVREVFTLANGFELPAVTFIPSEIKGGPVVVTGQGSKWERREQVKPPLYAGHPVTVVDLFATGEIAEGCTGADKPAFEAALKAKGLTLAEIQKAERKEVEALLKRDMVRNGETKFLPVRELAKLLPLRTAELQRRIDDLAAKGGGTLTIAPGDYVVGALYFKPGVNLHLEKGARLIGSGEDKDYPGKLTRVEGRMKFYATAIINADYCDGFRITGEGEIDGNGYALWKEFWSRWKGGRDPNFKNSTLWRPRVLFVSNSKNVDVSGVTFRNSRFWTTHYYKCEDVHIHHCRMLNDRIENTVGPSTDGIDLDGCYRVHVHDVYLDVNDDAVVVKGGMGAWANDLTKRPDCSFNADVLVENCRFGPMCHACLTLGSDCPGATNIVIRNCQLDGPHLGLHLKMRTDTPQRYSKVRAENLTGSCGCLVQVCAWTQYEDLEGRAREEVKSCADDVLVKNCKVKARRPNNIQKNGTTLELTNFRVIGGGE